MTRSPLAPSLSPPHFTQLDPDRLLSRAFDTPEYGAAVATAWIVWPREHATVHLASGVLDNGLQVRYRNAETFPLPSCPRLIEGAPPVYPAGHKGNEKLVHLAPGFPPWASLLSLPPNPAAAYPAYLPLPDCDAVGASAVHHTFSTLCSGSFDPGSIFRAPSKWDPTKSPARGSVADWSSVGFPGPDAVAVVYGIAKIVWGRCTSSAQAPSALLLALHLRPILHSLPCIWRFTSCIPGSRSSAWALVARRRYVCTPRASAHRTRCRCDGCRLHPQLLLAHLPPGPYFCICSAKSDAREPPSAARGAKEQRRLIERTISLALRRPLFTQCAVRRVVPKREKT